MLTLPLVTMISKKRTKILMVSTLRAIEHEWQKLFSDSHHRYSGGNSCAEKNF